jgi:hypothetical protein
MYFLLNLLSLMHNAAISCGFVVVSVVLFKHKNEQRKSRQIDGFVKCLPLRQYHSKYSIGEHNNNKETNDLKETKENIPE